jgi:hypothetical protein
MRFASFLIWICAAALLIFPVIPPKRLAQAARKTKPVAETSKEIIPEKQGPPARTAESDAPKFALLVGINDYLQKAIQKLYGAVNDTELVKDVLVRRFGFDPNNILILTNEKATKEAILKAFRDYLIKNAEKYKGKNPIIVFHFSGHGSQAADQNGDEADKWDETLVPYDSRDMGNMRFDIIDDELDELFQELNRYTSNITFILDSCHSGAASRGGESLIAREIPRDERPQPKRESKNNSRGDNPPEFEPIGLMPRGDGRSVTVSGCLSFQRSYEKLYGSGKAKVSHGILTWNLMQTLRRATPRTTWRALMEDVSAAVAKESAQNPQVEGDIGRAVLGGSAIREDAYIRITKVTGQQITMEAGEAQGIRTGTILAIYAPEAMSLVGDEKRLANAVVTDVSAFSSIAKLPELKENPKARLVSEKAKAVLLAPNLGGEPLRVALNAGLVARGGNSNNLARSVADILRDKQLLETKLITFTETAPATAARDGASKDGWDIALKKAKFGDLFPDEESQGNIAPKAKSDGNSEQKKDVLPSKDEEVLYIDAGGGQPLFGYFVRPDDPRGAEKLAKVIENLAKQRNLKALANASSPLNDGIKVSVVQVRESLAVIEGKQKLVREDKGELALSEKQAAYLLDQGVVYRIKVENRTGKDVYVAVANLGTDGAIQLMYPRAGAKEKLVNGNSVVTPMYRTTAPAGVESFKVIATTNYVDFSFLEVEGIRRGEDSPLQRLVTQSGVKTRSDPVDESPVADWGTKQVDLIITRKKLAIPSAN